MAQRQRKPPQGRTIDDLTRETRDIAGRLNDIARPNSPGNRDQNQAVRRLEQEYNRYKNMTPEERERAQITPEQMERLERAHDQLVRRIKDIQSGGPRLGQRAAPRRVFNYDVTIGSGPEERTYRVTLNDQLPAGRESQMLIEMAKPRANDNDFFESEPRGTVRVTTPGAPAPRMQVTQTAGPGMQEFNQMVNDGRVDNLQVALNRAREANPADPGVMVVFVPPQPRSQQQSRPGGG
jgi:hypothetical protein